MTLVFSFWLASYFLYFCCGYKMLQSVEWVWSRKLVNRDLSKLSIITFGDILLLLITLQEVINHKLFASQISVFNIKWDLLTGSKKRNARFFFSIKKISRITKTDFDFLSENPVYFERHMKLIFDFMWMRYEISHMLGRNSFFARSQMQLFWYNTLILRFFSFLNKQENLFINHV